MEKRGVDGTKSVDDDGGPKLGPAGWSRGGRRDGGTNAPARDAAEPRTYAANLRDDDGAC